MARLTHPLAVRASSEEGADRGLAVPHAKTARPKQVQLPAMSTRLTANWRRSARCSSGRQWPSLPVGRR